MNNAISITVQALLGGSGVTAIVGARVEPLTAPQAGTLPDIIVNQSTSQDEMLLEGQGQYPNARIRTECRARTRTAVIALGDAVIARLRNLRGAFAGVEVTSFLQTETDMTDNAEDFSTYRRVIDWYVRYRSA